MKKLLVMISAFVLTTVSTNQLVEDMISTNILKPIIKNDNKELKEFKQLNDEEKIDFNKVENYFKDEKNKKDNKFNGINNNNSVKNENSINNAFAKALEYTREFKEKNMSLSEIISKFKNEIPRFKTVFERELNKQLKTNSINFKSIYENTLPKFNNEKEQKLKLEAAEFWNQLNNIKNVLATSIAIAAIAAAGFWAAAWLGGISIPWAVAATAATAAMGVMLSGLNIYLSATNPYMNKILQGTAITFNAGLLVYEFVSTVIKVFTIGTITLSGTSIIMPAFTAIAAAVVALYYWVGQTSIFKQLEGANNFDEAINKINENNTHYIYNEYYQANKGVSFAKSITKLLDWTKFSSSIDEFKQNIKGLFFVNVKGFAGDSEDNKVLNTLFYNISDIGNSLSESKQKVILEHIYDGWFCKEHDILASNIYFENNEITAKFIFQIGTNCIKMNYVKLRYESVNVIL